MIEYLLSLQQTGIKLGLDQIRRLNELLDRPDRHFRSILVAGTNGKGSVTAMLERGLRAAGYRTGRYTSPHLSRLEERFAIDGLSVDSAALEWAATRIRQAAEQMIAPPSFFEATTAVAFELFREAQVDVAVLEVGLGGRLDATNIVTPEAVAITQIDFDHEAWLGHTLEQIAGEKAGIIKPGILATLGENPLVVRDVISAAAAAAQARLIYAPDGVQAFDLELDAGHVRCSLSTPHASYADLTLALRGRHQLSNVITTVRLLEALCDTGQFEVSAGAIRTAVEGVAWPARLELLTWNGSQVLIDGAHNPAGARALAEYVREVYGRRLPFVVGVMQDKRVDDVLEALAPAAACFVCTAAGTSRAETPANLAARAAKVVAPDAAIGVVDIPMDALARAASFGSPVVVAGSLYLAGEIRSRIA